MLWLDRGNMAPLPLEWPVQRSTPGPFGCVISDFVRSEPRPRRWLRRQTKPAGDSRCRGPCPSTDGRPVVSQDRLQLKWPSAPAWQRLPGRRSPFWHSPTHISITII